MDVQPHDFKFTLIIDGKEWDLPQAPEGWEESTLQWARSLEYFGLFRTFSVPLRFVLDGAWLLRRTMYRHGVDGVAILKIELLDRKTWQYELLYEGDIDFSTFDDTLTSVESKMMEMGIGASIAAFSNVDYEWAVRPEDVVQLRLPGIDRVEIGMQAFTGFFTGFSYYFMPAVFITCNELTSGAVILQEVQYNLGWSGAPEHAFLIGGPTDQTVRIRGEVEVSFNPSNPNNYYLVRFGDNLSTIGTLLYSLVDTRDLTPGTRIVEFDFTYTIVAGRNYFISVQRNGAAISDPINFSIDFASINITAETTTGSTVINAYRPKKLLQMLFDRMHGAGVPVQSSVLETWDNLLITSGDMIRGIDGATLKTNFNDFFKSINAVLNVGFSVLDGVPMLEEKSFFFRSILMALDLGDSVKSVSVKPAEDFMFNSIKAGYPNDDYEVDQGREEFNSGQVWSTNIKRVQKQLDLTSAYRADQYGIEQLRLARENESGSGDGCTTPNARRVDNKNDNEVFFIHAQKTPGPDGIFDVIGTEAYSDITGISARSSSYNLGISPKNNLMRHNDFLAGALYNNSFGLRLESADKNADLSTTTLAGDTVRQRDPILVSNMGTPLFLPFRVDLTTDLQFGAWKLLQTNSTGYIRFIWRDHVFYGYVLEISQNIERNSERTISLILSPNSDISKLIY